MVRETSIEALQKYLDAGKDRTHKAQVLRHVINRPPSTRAEISQATGISLQTVCGRVNELLELGQVVEVGRRPCGVTGSMAMTIGPVEGSPQWRLF